MEGRQLRTSYFGTALLQLGSRPLTGVSGSHRVTPMVKTQVYLPKEQLVALHRVAKQEGRSVAELIRDAVGKVWLRPRSRGPVALWSGHAKRSSVEHDSIYDEP